MKYILLGAGFETGNLGVSALAHGAISLIRKNSPDAGITLVDYGKATKTYNFTGTAATTGVNLLNIRYSKNIFLPNHIFRLCFLAFLLKALPRRQREACISRNICLNAIHHADVVCAISGGDSFSDIYGLNRLLYVSLPQILVILLKRPLVLLPQTYGPFESLSGRFVARWIIRRANRIYSRDQAGLTVVQTMLGCCPIQPQFALDVAFAMKPKEPNPPVATLPLGTVGLNVSGLLYSSSWSTPEKQESYAGILRELVRFFVTEAGLRVVLVPHVLGDSGENDISAAQDFHQSLPPSLRDSVQLLDAPPDAREIKYLIGQCEFFIGSRMHACIAALSQCIPAVGLAYSRKFSGVFESVGVGSLVIDLNATTKVEAVEQTKAAWFHRKEYMERLSEFLPPLETQIRDFFTN